MSAGHTAGPWAVSFDGARVYSKTRTEWIVADCSPLNAEVVRVEANARLIAAAPELLEALEWALERVPVPNSVCKDEAVSAYAAARAAIAKATGAA